MLERFARLIRRPKRGPKGGKARSRKPKRRSAKSAAGFFVALAERPMLLVACGAGIGLVVGALLATHLPAPPGPAPVEATAPKTIVKQQLASVPPQPREVESEPAAPPPPAPPASALPAPGAPPPPNVGGRPAWQQYARAVPETGGRPMIAIVIDDMGIDRAESAKVIELPSQITIAFMTYAKDLARQATAARVAGHELWLHVPMEPLDRGLDAGPDVLRTELSTEENRRRLDWALAQLDGYVGINNHMGSRFTSSEADMKPVLEEVKARGLAFLDSRTTAATVAGKMASEMGLPHIDRDVFIDNDETVAAVLAQLQRTEEIARKRGRALAIGHPHATTIAALRQWLPTLKGKGFVLVPASALLHRETATAG